MPAVKGRVGSPPPGSKLYPACGGVKIESIGWSNSTPPPGTPLPGIGAAKYVLVSRTGKYGPPLGVRVGVPPLVPVHHDVLALTVSQQQAHC